MGYLVQFYQNNLWEVYNGDEVVFRGNLAECNSWIQLEKDGYFG